MVGFRPSIFAMDEITRLQKDVAAMKRRTQQTIIKVAQGSQNELSVYNSIAESRFHDILALLEKLKSEVA